LEPIGCIAGVVAVNRSHEHSIGYECTNFKAMFDKHRNGNSQHLRFQTLQHESRLPNTWFVVPCATFHDRIVRRTDNRRMSGESFDYGGSFVYELVQKASSANAVSALLVQGHQYQALGVCGVASPLTRNDASCPHLVGRCELEHWTEPFCLAVSEVVFYRTPRSSNVSG
tara:strand:+ start:266 stop:775 length:510 start_codon:yes stop_codon:yes gene_type:complete